MIIRDEKPGDYLSVYRINASTFKTSVEAKLVEALRKEAHPYISLVAEVDGEIEGHVMFTPVTLTGHEHLLIMGLGPVAVMPRNQGNGIGSALIEVGLERCRGLGYGACVVLGHPRYYPRFGFVPSVAYGIGCEYDVPPEVFMVKELLPGYLQGASGVIKYHPAFKGV